MKKILTFTALSLAAGAAAAGITGIAQLPLLNISGSGTVKPNLMLLYDNSGSMNYNYTPDYINTSMCRSRTLLSSGVTNCAMGHPPFNSADFNRQYYDPNVTYSPPVRADGTSFPSLDRANTSTWTKVTIDGYGINTTDFNNSTVSTSNLTTGFPDLRWCDSSNNCGYNVATYTYPNDTNYTSKVYGTNPYYYSINVAEYCTDSNLKTCQTTMVGAPAPAGYPVPAKVRWCDSRALTNCQAKYVGNFIYPRFSNPNSGVVAAYGTITIDSSDSGGALSIDSVSITEPSGTVVITNGPVSASTGTNSTTKQATVATSLAAAIIAKTGLTNQYTACVRTPTPTNSSVPACSSLGVTLGSNNVVAVVPITCVAGTTGKAIGPCSVLADDSRSGWPITVSAPSSQVAPPQLATALITVSGTAGSSNKPTLSGISLGGTQLLPGGLTFNTSATSSAIATAIKAGIGTRGTITAYIGGTTGYSDACANASTSTICLVNTAANAGGQAVTIGTWTNNVGAGGNSKTGTVVLSGASSTSAGPATYDAIPVSATPLGAGAAVFVRTDIVPSRTSYPKATGRLDCDGDNCTYDEEMTNFANWYGYYRTRNQMMKTAVGQAFQPITSNYKVGIVSLSVAAAEGKMTPPAEFKGTERTAWYNSLYSMSTTGSTPLRQALHAIGKMYANLSPYATAAGSEVVQYPCQQNFTFVTTDGYWNGAAAATVVNNDNVENPARFCTRARGCVDPSVQTANSLADVALYWYNGGSNTTVSSLRPTLEDWTRPGLVPAAAGENTRLHMNTYTLGLGVDGIMNYEPNYDTNPLVGGDFYKLITGVASGCPWNNNGPYVWPDPVTGNSSTSGNFQSRVDDLWHAAINGHGKYFSAADPKQVVEGLRTALSNIEVRIGAAAAAATSTPNISQQDNDIFSDTFTTVRWYGELSDRKLDPVTGIVSTTTVWNSSDMVGRKVADASDTRSIYMLDVVNGGLKDFRYGTMTAVERAWFDNKCTSLAQCASLSAADRALVNNGSNIVNWLRGQQQHANDNVMRAYAKTDHNPPGLSGPLPIVLGDIASSKPAYMRDPRKNYPAADYSQFKVDNAQRKATVFVAANDGMLHAFDAASGEERWAYVPRITMKKLYVQASTTYGTNHQFTADGSPEVADVKVGTRWRSVLVAGLNGGGRGYYALDVTDPLRPTALWELCADSTVCSGSNFDADIGLSFGNPQFGTWKDAGGTERWVVFLTSGYNNVPGIDGVAGGSGKGYLYVVDIATGQVLNKSSTGAGDTSTPSGFAKITAISTDPMTDPRVTDVYGGDNLGKMWRFDFTTQGSPAVVQMGDAGSAQPVTTRPDVTMCRVDSTDAQGVVSMGVRKVAVFGTGRLLDVPDIGNTDVQSLYVLKDSASGISTAQWRNASSMPRQQLTRIAGAGGDIYTINGTAVNLATQAGWFVDFDRNRGERVNLDPKVVAGGVTVVTNLPTASSSCSVGGTSNVYQLNVCTGAAIVVDNGNSIAGSTLSNTSAAVGFIVVRLPSGALKMVTTTADGGTITTGIAPAATTGAQKAGWRRVRE